MNNKANLDEILTRDLVYKLWKKISLSIGLEYYWKR